jgi:hypothetical protein
MKRDIIRQLADLDRATVPELKRKWREMFGSESPGYNRTFIIKRLSYRIQEEAYGGVSAETRAALNAVLDAAGYDELGRPGKEPTVPVAGERMVLGTTLVRLWNDRRHVVTVLDNGFEYQGKPYRSLTAIATEISGSKWNGPAFFGLRQKGKATVRRRSGNGE